MKKAFKYFGTIVILVTIAILAAACGGGAGGGYIPPGGGGGGGTGGGMTYSLGDTGPAGGIIIYVNPTGFTVQGYGNSGDSGYFAA